MKKAFIAVLLSFLFVMSGCVYNTDPSEGEGESTVNGEAVSTYAEVTEADTEEAGCLHDWGEWFISSWPTKNNEGREMHYCSMCGERETRPIDKLPENDYLIKLNVDNILQFPDYPNGCEIVSLAIVLKHLGFKTDPAEINEKYLEKSLSGTGDPFLTYIGTPEIAESGIGCYAPCIANAARSYLDDNGLSEYTVRDVSGFDFADFEAFIDKGIPVILWGLTNMDCDPTVCMTFNTDGGDVIWRAHSHCLVLIGYTANTYLFCDPQKEGVTEYQKRDVRDSHDLVYRQAVVVHG